MRNERDRVEAAFLEACVDMFKRDPVHLRALPPACKYFATQMLAGQAKTAKAKEKDR